MNESSSSLSLKGARSAEVRMEKGGDAASRIHCGWFVVSNSAEAQEFEPELLFIVHKRVSGVRVLFDVVWNERPSQCALQLVGCTLLPPALATIASDNRAGRLKECINVGWKFSAVVDAGCRESMIRHKHQREPTPHAESNHANLTGAFLVLSKPLTTGFDIIERRAGPRDKIPRYRADATQESAQVIEINSKRKEAGLSKPVSLIAMVFAHPANIVQDNDPGVRLRICRLGEVTPHLSARCLNHDISHQSLLGFSDLG
jgi:hypothetical protein